MLQPKQVVELQTNFGVASGEIFDAEYTFGEYLAQCRSYITQNRSKEYEKGNMDPSQRTSHITDLVSQFVDNHKIRVKGYIRSDGTSDAVRLLQDLEDAVTGVSVLRLALEDPDVDEIQINDKDTIYVSKGGVLVLYRDKENRVLRFSSNDEVATVITKLIDDGEGNVPQLTDGYALLNAKTHKEQYRLNAVHHSANTQDKPPYNFPITNVTLRKFKETKLKIEDIIRSGACTAQMGRFLTALGRAQLKLFCVGPTGSGKTTLLNIIAEGIPRTKRVILIQNPSEITLIDRDPVTRANRWNAVHHEAQDIPPDRVTPQSPTMVNLISNALRETPDILLLGESRTADEFEQALRAMQTGQLIMGTFHAASALEATGRFATELSSKGGSIEVYRQIACDVLDIIIAQFRYPDGRRRIIEISEVLGVNPDGSPNINTLFEFKETGRVTKNKEGLDEVEGNFVQTGRMSPQMVRKFFRAGVSAHELAEFMTAEMQAEYKVTLPTLSESAAGI